MNKLIKNIILVLIISTNALMAQLTMRFPELVVDKGADIKVPLLVSGFNNIGALSLVIKYNPAVLNFTGVTGQPENFLVNSTPGNIYMAFAELLPFSSSDDTLLYLNFSHISGNSLIEFTSESETADINVFVLPAVFVSGKVTDSQFQTSSLGDRVWIDSNKNGLQDAGEKGLQWVTVELFGCNNAWVGYTLTDSSGRYSFNDLYEGDYYLRFRLADANSSYRFTIKSSGTDTTADSDADPLNDTTAVTVCVHVTGGIPEFDIDAGVYLPSNLTADDYYLAQNYPNPFNPSTTISFMLPRKEFVTITIFNLLGEKVRVLLNEEREQGTHFVEFDASGIRSGVYFYRLTTPGTMLTGKMVLER